MKIAFVRIPGFLFLFTLFLCSCAQIVAPTGGPKDIQAPRIKKYMPDSAALRFNDKNILIVFDEYIQLKNIQSQLIVSPALKYPPVVQSKGKTLSIKLKDTLRESTTYTFNFGDAIQDITEGNPVLDFRYIFSTGDFIDSLSLRGKVINAFSGTPEKGTWVMLYTHFDDSVPYKELPHYFSRTDNNGQYKISNIRSGKYKIVALKDVNNNYLFDQSEELIGFVTDPLIIEKDTSVDLSIFKEPLNKQFLKKAYNAQFGRIDFAFARPTAPDEISIRALDFTNKKEWYVEEWNKQRDSLKLWVTDIPSDTLRLQVNSYNQILDTVEFKLQTLEEAMHPVKGNPVKWGYTSNAASGILDINSPLKITFPALLPVQPLLRDKGFFKKDSLLYPIEFWKESNNLIIRPLDFHDTVMVNDPNHPGQKKSTVHFKELVWPENSRYQLLIPPGTFNNMYNIANDSIQIDFKSNEEKFYGKLKLDLQVPDNADYQLELTDANGKLIRSISVKSKELVSFDYIKPGKYQLRLIVDTINNGTWDTGSYEKKRQPERVVYYPQVLQMRGNWDMELEWKVE